MGTTPVIQPGPDLPMLAAARNISGGGGEFG